MAKLKEDRFIWLDKMTAERGGASVEEITKVFGIGRAATISWLCRWENYYNDFLDLVQHFITRVPGNPSLYVTGPDPWHERQNNGVEVGLHTQHDVEGINPLHVSLGFIKTRTDSITHKRTLKGTRRTAVYMKWIESNNGVTSSAFAHNFNLSPRSASMMLSRWKKTGVVVLKDRTWRIAGQRPKELEVVLKVVGHYDEEGRRHVKDEWQTVEREESVVSEEGTG